MLTIDFIKLSPKQTLPCDGGGGGMRCVSHYVVAVSIREAIAYDNKLVGMSHLSLSIRLSYILCTHVGRCCVCSTLYYCCVRLVYGLYTCSIVLYVFIQQVAVLVNHV